jgi:hypothetical protein
MKDRKDFQDKLPAKNSVPTWQHSFIYFKYDSMFTMYQLYVMDPSRLQISTVFFFPLQCLTLSNTGAIWYSSINYLSGWDSNVNSSSYFMPTNFCQMLVLGRLSLTPNLHYRDVPVIN